MSETPDHRKPYEAPKIEKLTPERARLLLMQQQGWDADEAKDLVDKILLASSAESEKAS